MLWPALTVRCLAYSLLAIVLIRDSAQNIPRDKHSARLRISPDRLCCMLTSYTQPVYPRQARMSRIQGIVKLTAVFASNGSVADVQLVSGDPLLLSSTMSAVRQWHVDPLNANGIPTEFEIPLTFTFEIADPPEPAYLHLTNHKVIRVSHVREFPDRIEYTVRGRIHRISPESVIKIDSCNGRPPVHLPLREGDCIKTGAPDFLVTAIPIRQRVDTTPHVNASRDNKIGIVGLLASWPGARIADNTEKGFRFYVPRKSSGPFAIGMARNLRWSFAK
jgi:TonB family protein